jgi:hypothetical protein
LEDNPVGRLKVYVYDLPSKYNKKLLKKDPRCLNHMFAAEIFMHRFLLSSAVRTFNPEEDAQRHRARRHQLAVLEQVGGRRPLLRHAT